MDLDRIPLIGTEGFLETPMGFAEPLAMSEVETTENNAQLLGYDSLTEAEKEEIILRCKGAKTREEMQQIVDSVAPGVDVQQVYEEERGNFI